MDTLGPPDSFHLSAAVGWMELGNLREAALELEKVAAGLRTHLEVLEVRWRLHAEQKDWRLAFEVAGQIMEQAPERPDGWLHRAYAARRAPGGSLETASSILQEAVEKFPKQKLIPFNLACYACQMGRLTEAREWLERAFRVGSRKAMKALALADEDLRALWPEIRTM